MIKSLIAIFITTANLTWASLPDNYETLTATEKQKLLWTNIMSTKYEPTNQPGYGSDSWESWLSRLKSSAPWVTRSFFTVTDDEREARSKMFHTYGSTAKVEWVAKTNPYTGVFSTGGIGLIRMGLGIDPKFMGYIPGIAIKILRDGITSANTHMMANLDGNESNSNFFVNDFTNVVPEPESFFLRSAIKTGKLFSSKVLERPVDTFAMYSKKGYQVRSDIVNVPYQIVIQANPILSWDGTEQLDPRTKFRQIKTGTTLFTIFARSENDQSYIEIGKIVSKSVFVDSKYADEELHFKHEE